MGQSKGYPLKKWLLQYFEDPAILFECFADLPYAIFLDSGYPFDQRERFSIISAKPIKVFSNNTENPFSAIKNYLDNYFIDKTQQDLPFQLGAMGYFGYDLGREFFSIDTQTINDIDFPNSVVGIYNWCLTVDHQEKKTWLLAENETLIDWIQSIINKPKNFTPFKITQPFESNFTFSDYEKAFNRIQYHILEGNVYQVNLCQRFSATYTGSLWDAYRQLRKINPAPFSVFFNLGEQAILSLSPERFLKVTKGVVETKPIKGTIARGKNATEDQQFATILQNSEKDLAENLMIVDLLRNDLGKCCEPGSIQVPKLAALESFPQVHHLVSTITGRLKKDTHAADLLQHCFPGGSITGAPKQSAMQIIESLEPHRRSVYCGSLGYLNFNGDMDTNIAIRTFIADKTKIHCYAGGGIVADSQLETEYQESLRKVSNLIEKLKVL